MLYYSRTYRSSVAGSVIKDVACEKCQCHYRYQLVRRGQGASSAAYGIGAGTARSTAEKRAQRKLQKRLAKGVDPVACPDCGWIQTPMVREMGRRRLRWLDIVGIVVLSVAALIAFCDLMSLSGTRSPRPSDWQDIAEIAGFGVLVLVVCMTVRRVLRRMGDPNAAYPAKPAPIPGAPKGFKVDANGVTEVELLPVDEAAEPSNALSYERKPAAISAGDWVTVQLMRIAYPATCCACMEPTAEVMNYRVSSSYPEYAPVRICGKCVKNAKWRKTITVIISGLIAGGVGWGMVWLSGASAREEGLAVGTAIAFAVFGMVMGIGISRRTADPVRFSRYAPDLNTVRIRFRNRGYTMGFADLNPST